MLTAEYRLRRSVDILDTLRHGRRLSSRLIVLHVLPGGTGQHPPRFAFAVGKNVGNSVVRHRTTRRLRHIVAGAVSQFEPGAQVVIRALPGAGAATSAQLAESLNHALGKGHLTTAAQA